MDDLLATATGSRGKRGATIALSRSVRAEARRDDGFDTTVPTKHDELHFLEDYDYRECGWLNTAAPPGASAPIGGL